MIAASKSAVVATKLATTTSDMLSQTTAPPLRGITDGHTATYSLSNGSDDSEVFSERSADVPEAAGVAAAAAAAAARNLADELEDAFLRGAFAGWEKMGAMMEKYDAMEAGEGGGGGEYDLQVSLSPPPP